MRSFAVVLGLLVVACGQNDDPNGAKDLYARVTAAQGYRAWRRAPGFPERKPSFTSHSDAVEIFVDPTVSAALDGPDPVRSWPVGSIIVKESFSGDATTLIAAMEKKADGTWFWAEYDADGKALFSGKPSVCVHCHDNRSTYSDWVYAFEFPEMNEPHDVSAALENALLREIREQYKLLALTYFKGALAIPQLELVPTRNRLGRWVPGTRTIELSRFLVLSEPWGVVVEVLKHEMAHQYVWDVLGEREETAHGPSFKRVCERLGIDGSAVGMPPVEPEVKHEKARVAERIAKLLALAESPNANEAEAAMAAAQRLLLKHNIELRALRTTQGYVWKHVGAPTGRTTEAERVLSLLIGKHFFVEAIWVSVYRPLAGKRGSVLEICGSPENVEIAEYVHGHLVATAERLWREHKVAHGIRGDRDRRTFLAGVMSGMSDKLAREAKKSADAGLVWVQDGDLHQYFRKRHPHVRHIRYAGQRRSEAYAHGKDAGAKIVIHRGMKDRPAERGLLLPGRR